MENEFKRKAICLRSSDSGDSDRLVTLFSLEEGKVKAKMKGVKKAKAKLAFASFPFCFGEYFWVKRGNFCTVTNCNFIDNFSTLLSDMNLYYAGCSMIEVVESVTKENQENDALFVILLKSLNVLAYGKNVNIFAVLSKFFYEVLRTVGYAITIDDQRDLLFLGEQDVSSEMYFDFDTGCISFKKTMSSILLSNKDSESFLQVCDSSLSDFDNTQNISKNVLKILVQFFELRVDEQLKIVKQFF